MSTIKIGAAEIRRVEEMSLRAPISGMTKDTELLSAHMDWLTPDFLDAEGFRELKFQSWILQLDGNVFVIDPCNGNGRPHPQPWFNMLDAPYIERFAATGVKPDDVDYVFCTHMHHDHCGWNTQLRGGKYVPTFPKARYMFVRREYERWDPTRPKHRPVDFNAGVFERSILPVVEAGLAELVDDRHAITPSVDIQPAYGHTLGHSILHFTSEMKHAYFSGDIIHHPIQIVDPRIHFPGCDDLDQAIETRRRFVNQCADSGAVIIPAHFPAPYAGHVIRRNGATIFEALKEGVA